MAENLLGKIVQLKANSSDLSVNGWNHNNLAVVKNLLSDERVVVQELNGIKELRQHTAEALGYPVGEGYLVVPKDSIVLVDDIIATAPSWKQKIVQWALSIDETPSDDPRKVARKLSVSLLGKHGQSATEALSTAPEVAEKAAEIMANGSESRHV
jgi:hypothetical protein